MKKYIKWMVSTVCAVGLAMSSVGLADEAWTVSLGGSGASVTKGDVNTVFGADLSVGRTGKLLLPVEGGLRQSVGFDRSDILATTGLYLDWTLFTVKTVDVFAGGNVGVTYGNTAAQWEIAPEAGVRWWVKNDVAVLGRVETPFDLDGWGFKDTVRYFVGFQVKF